jgi:hypothetical protein
MSEAVRGPWRLWHLCFAVAAVGILCAFLRTEPGLLILTLALAAVVATVLTRRVLLDLRDERRRLAENGEGSRIGGVAAACGLGVIWLMSFSVVLAVLLGVVLFFQAYNIRG